MLEKIVIFLVNSQLWHKIHKLQSQLQNKKKPEEFLPLFFCLSRTARSTDSVSLEGLSLSPKKLSLLFEGPMYSCLTPTSFLKQNLNGSCSLGWHVVVFYKYIYQFMVAALTFVFFDIYGLLSQMVSS